MASSTRHSMSEETSHTALARPEIIPKTLQDVVGVLNSGQDHAELDGSNLSATTEWEMVVRSQNLLQAIYDCEFDRPSTLQAYAIATLCGGKGMPPKSMFANAPPGSGKTFASIISMMSHIDPKVKSIQAVCLCATPELVDHSAEAFETFNSYTRYVCGVCRTNDDPVPADCQVLFARPLNLADRSKAACRSEPNYIDLSQVQILIVDEADELCKKENVHLFRPMVVLVKQLSKEIPIGFFSATFAEFALQEAKHLRPNLDVSMLRCVPKRIIHSVISRNQWDDTMESVFMALWHSVGLANKLIVFVGNRLDVCHLENFCKKEGISSGKLIGGRNPKKPDVPFMTLEERRDVVRRFKSSQEDGIRVLITTDLGCFDLLNCPVVINFDFPYRYDQRGKRRGVDVNLYQHKAGRSGRFGRTGIIINVCSDPREKDGYADLCARLNIPELWEIIPDPTVVTPSP